MPVTLTHVQLLYWKFFLFSTGEEEGLSGAYNFMTQDLFTPGAIKHVADFFTSAISSTSRRNATVFYGVGICLYSLSNYLHYKEVEIESERSFFELLILGLP